MVWPFCDLTLICSDLSVVFRMSGLSPFAGEDDLETLNNVKRCDWDFDSEAFKGISDIGKDFIRKLLIKQPG